MQACLQHVAQFGVMVGSGLTVGLGAPARWRRKGMEAPPTAHFLSERCMLSCSTAPKQPCAGHLVTQRGRFCFR